MQFYGLTNIKKDAPIYNISEQLAEIIQIEHFLDGYLVLGPQKTQINNKNEAERGSKNEIFE